MKTSDFFYELPERLIAQHPADKRDHSRLMCLNRREKTISDSVFYELPDKIMPGDCLILNDSRVLPARIFGKREEGEGINEFLLLNPVEKNTWETITKPGKKAKTGAKFSFGEGLLIGEVADIKPDGNRIVKFTCDGEFYSVLDKIGQIPLPPYITETLRDKERYQTVYSRETGSAAAPTAGLHFTKEMLNDLESRGVGIGYVTLHVGLGTFRPVKSDDIMSHHMHSEHYYLPMETAELINKTRERGGRVICVGTTSCRTLETCARSGFPLREQDGWTDIFIYPGYEFKVMDAIITNFHLPESTLIMLISAFAGREFVLEAYKQAVMREYRFFSFGDAMFIE